MIEVQASRTLDAVSVVLQMAAEAVSDSSPNQSLAALGGHFKRALQGVPYVRSLLLLDEQGRVLISTQPNAADQVLKLSVGAGEAPGDRPRIGAVVPGAPNVSQGGASGDGALSGRFIPMALTVRSAWGGVYSVVATIDPEVFEQYPRQILADQGAQFALTNLRGEVLAGTAGRQVAFKEGAISTDAQAVAPNQHASYLSHREGQTRVVAYRASRTWPVVVWFERDMSRLQPIQSPLVVWGVVSGLLLLAMSVVVWRSLRARERARGLFVDVRDKVMRSERELSVLLRSLQELVFRTDASGVVTFVNARWSALGGSVQVKGRALFDVLVPEQVEEGAALFSLNSQDGVRHCRAVMKIVDGCLRHFELAVVPLMDAGKITAFAGSAVDITELLEAQQQLQMQLSWTGRLLEIIPQPVFMTDDKARVVMVNRAWEDFKGYTRAQVIGKRLDEFLPQDEAILHRVVEDKLTPDGGVHRAEVRIRRAGGIYRIALISKVMVVSDKGGLTGVLTVLTDVTEFREAEQAIREARDVAEEASRAKSEFVANISHELRTPLQSIIGFSELGLLRGSGNALFAGMFQDIHVSGQRMLALVNDLLDVSKIESTVGTFHLERIDLRGAIRSVTRELQPLLDRKHLALDLQLSGEALLAKADPLRFQQVIRNVMANAIKFSPPGSTVEVKGEVTDEGEIHVAIRDHGPGIPEPELEKIFEAFVQSSKTKDGSGGTGLGLAICRKIIDAHGGRIRAGNVPGDGAVFDIYLPYRTGPDTAPAPL